MHCRDQIGMDDHGTLVKQVMTHDRHMCRAVSDHGVTFLQPT